VSELRDLVQKIAQQNRTAESHEFADDVQTSMSHELSGERNRGVREAPFIVLTGANMPAILTEISFISNAQDETDLQNPNYRQKIARALYDGVATYVNGLSGVASPSQPVVSLASTSGGRITTPPLAANIEVPAAEVGWASLMLGFIAANRPFIVIFFLLAAAWSFFLTSPTAAQPAAALAEAASPSEALVDNNLPAYSSPRKLRLIQRL
jgi:hypothetical protein